MDESVLNEVAGLPVTQIAWVVDDLQKAMSHWLSLGVGPFFTLDVDSSRVLYRGQPSILSMSVALAHAGPVQIELIQQTSEEPTAYTDGASSGAARFHHICRAFGGYDETVSSLKDQGVVIAMEGRFGDDDRYRYCYLDARDTLGCFIELCDDSEIGQKTYATTRDAAKDWDGQDPIRSLQSLYT